MARKWKRALAALLLICLLPAAAFTAADTEKGYTYINQKELARYESETLTYTLSSCKMNGTVCYLTLLWMADPARQVKKAISPWHQALAKAEDLAKKIEGAAIVINGSGYVSPTYPEIPESYPGESADYYYTPLGSLTVVDGEIYRNLEGIPFYGLTLEADGLHMYHGADNEEVLLNDPRQTWSFYEGCPMAEDGVDLLDHDWAFANRRAIRTILCKLRQENTYLILTATSSHGLTLVEANEFLMGEFDPLWIYDLDGGPSSALLRRLYGKKTLKLIYGAGQRIVDVMGFVE